MLLSLLVLLVVSVVSAEPSDYFLKFDYENNFNNLGSGGANCNLANADAVANYSLVAKKGTYSRQYNLGFDRVNDSDSGGTCNFTDGGSFSTGGWYYFTETPSGLNQHELIFAGDIDETNQFIGFHYDGGSGVPKLVAFNNAGTFASYTTTLSLNTWHHLFITYNSSSTTLRMYLNGTDVSNDPSSNVVLSFPVGGNPAGWSQSGYIHAAQTTKGLTDQTYYYARFLNSSEVTDLYLNLDAPIIPPIINNTINLLSRTPADITTSTPFTYPNITLNYQYFNTTNLSLPYSLNYTVTSSLSGCVQYQNGSCILISSSQRIAYPQAISLNNSNQSVNVSYSMTENDVFPYTQNFNILNNTYTYANISLTGTNDYHKESFYNLSTTANYTLIVETSLNTTGLAKIYLANSSYGETINPATNTNVYDLCNILSTQPYNHTHNNGVIGHYLCAVNVVNGKVGNVQLTVNSYVLTHNEAGTLQIRAINEDVRTGSARVSLNNGVTWSNSLNQYAHIHQFSGLTYVQFQTYSKLKNGSNLFSSIINDTFELDYAQPTPPLITNPIDFSNTGATLNITYSSAGTNVFYNISLLNTDLTFNRTIITNNSDTLFYNWKIYNETDTLLGQYYVKVEAKNINGTARDIQGVNITRNARVNITAISTVGGTTINVFNGWIYHVETGLNTTYNTTTGQAYADTLRGNLTIFIDAENYTLNYTYSVIGRNTTLNLLNQQFRLYTTNTLNITFYDQANPTIILNGVNVSLDLISTTYSTSTYTTTGTSLLTLLNPNTYTLRYRASGFTERFYTATVDNRSYQALNLYLMNATISNNLTITVIDETTDPVVNVQVKILRFDLPTNTYVIDEIGITNSQGITRVNAILNGPFYKFIVQEGTDVLLITDPEILISTTKTISVGTSVNYGEEGYQYNDYTALLTFNKATNNFRLDFNDGDNIGDGTILIVYIVENGTYTYYNSSSTTSGAGTILVGVSNVSGRTYSAFAYYIDPSRSGQYIYLAGKSYTYLSTPIFGVFGLFMQILLTIGMSSLIFLNAPVAVVLTPLSIGLGVWLGWTQISWSIVLGLIAAGLLIAYMLMGKK